MDDEARKSRDTRTGTASARAPQQERLREASPAQVPPLDATPPGIAPQGAAAAAPRTISRPREAPPSVPSPPEEPRPAALEAPAPPAPPAVVPPSPEEQRRLARAAQNPKHEPL
jgi:hypothetical protein